MGISPQGFESPPCHFACLHFFAGHCSSIVREEHLLFVRVGQNR